ncbi:hypothetical protein WJX82_006030 [Trebouxia sp. C0006]
MDESDRESWSFVDEDEAKGRVSPAPSSDVSTVLTQGGTATGELSRTQSLVTSGQLNGVSGESGNDSPSRPAVLEAVDGSSPQQQWRLAEQRGNDIRRARAPPCPKAVGPDCFLKVIVVGEAGLGKTTFVQNLQAAFQPDGPSTPRVAPTQDESDNIYELFEQSPQQLCTEVTINTETSKFHYLLQDTPGLVYGQTSVRIPDYITKQNNAYLAWEQDPSRCAPMSATVDHRVDACLFFLNPNHLKDAEVAAMAALAEMVPVVPMIAKADIFTPSELTAFRLHVQKRITEEEEKLGKNIMWRANEDSQGEGELNIGEDHGRCSQPPFAVIASNNTDLAVGRFWPVRTYPWGKCEALSSSNSDLSSLKRLLFEDGFADLKQATEKRYYEFRTAHLTQPAAGQVVPVAEDVTDTEEEEVAETSVELETESDSDDVSDISQPEDLVAIPAENVQGGHVERHGRRNMWMWGVVIASIVCCSLIGSNNKLQADKKALQKELNSARNLADMKDQAASQMEAYKPLAGEAHLKPHTVVQMRDSLGDGSGCTMLISAWHETLQPAAKHTRRQARLAAAQNASNDEPIIVQEVVEAEQLSTASSNTSAAPVSGSEAAAHSHLLPDTATTPEAMYMPRTFGSASHTAVQSVALQQAGHASALVLRSLGSDVAEASRSVVRSAPMVMRKVQEDVGHKLEGAQAMVKHAGHSVSHRVTHATHHVSTVANQTMHNMRILNAKVSMPRIGWDAKTWLRIMARLGLLGAAL